MGVILFLLRFAADSIEGHQAIHTATTDELWLVLSSIEASLRRLRGNAAARRTRDRIRTLWP